ncbi:hybrid sensor histidine kinase/response regulator [Geofilum sp. OHC36d9]|uniref:hybrid sensor histidine kinase/response regulator n=1 Tax=Geofilum sp. OHC36d9 TaxID=3458413 RepID=UPI004033646A
MKNSKILIVDDNTKNIQVLASTLSDLYNIEYTTDGYDAINWIKAEPFDLILLDITMPTINGLQVCETIRKDESFNDIPIIFITARTDTESIVKGFKVGGQDYITKPFNDEELKERIKTHLELKKSKEKLSDVNKWLQQEVEKKTAELQTAYKELEVLDIAKDEFLSLVSHELRTPINGIMGFTGILKSSINSEKLLGYINILEVSSNRLLKFTLSASLITALRSNRVKFEPAKLNILTLIKEMELSFKDRIVEKMITLKYSNLTDNLFLWGDHDLALEALKCIFENAINYSPINSIIELSISDDNKKTTISIEDNGPGFSEQALKNIFKPFGYGQPHVDQNIGLSLHLVKLIMNAHKSEIHISNTSGGGAKVDLTFAKNDF